MKQFTPDSRTKLFYSNKYVQDSISFRNSVLLNGILSGSLGQYVTENFCPLQYLLCFLIKAWLPWGIIHHEFVKVFQKIVHEKYQFNRDMLNQILFMFSVKACNIHIFQFINENILHGKYFI